MSHWAKVENGIVTQITVGDNNDPAGDEGLSWLKNNLGGTWIKTSFNTYAGKHSLGGVPLRKNYAGVGYVYDETRDAFYAPSPFPSWKLNEDTCIWEAPTPMPTDGKIYQWVEADLNWQVVTPQVG